MRELFIAFAFKDKYEEIRSKLNFMFTFLLATSVGKNSVTVTRIFICGAGSKHRTTLSGVSRTQTGFLVGRFCFHSYTESCLDLQHTMVKCKALSNPSNLLQILGSRAGLKKLDLKR